MKIQPSGFSGWRLATSAPIGSRATVMIRTVAVPATSAVRPASSVKATTMKTSPTPTVAAGRIQANGARRVGIDLPSAGGVRTARL